MQLLKIMVFAAFVLFILRLSGKWPGHLPHWMPELFSRDNTAGQRPLDSGSDSDTDAEAEGDDWGEEESTTAPMVGPAVTVGPGADRVAVQPRRPVKPRLGERFTGRLERMTGEPKSVPVTPEPEVVTGSPADSRQALREHLLAERERPGLPSTRIVKSAANEPYAPWGCVSERTVWRAWKSLPPR